MAISFGARHASKRDRGIQLCELGRIVHGAEIDRRCHGARTNANDQDIVRRELDPGGAGEHPHAAFGEAIGRIAGHRPVLVHRRNVDDAAAAALLDHLLGGDLRAEKRALEVDGHDTVILILSGVEDRRPCFDAGVVHHDVEPPEISDRRIDKLLQIRGLADVGVNAERPAAKLGDLLFLCLRRFRVNDIVDDHACALARQLKTDRSTDTAVAAGDDRNLVLQRHAPPPCGLFRISTCVESVTARRDGR